MKIQRSTSKLILLLLAASPFWTAATLSATDPVPADVALARLREGNARYNGGQASHPHQDAARRSEVAAAQSPFAVIVGCADSRTAPEILFDQGLGDVFVVRLAGNIVDDAALGSIEFAVAKLGARLIVVLGHEKCGAVTAAVDAVKTGASFPGHLGSFIEEIKPAAVAAKDEPGDKVVSATLANVRGGVGKLQAADPVLAPLVKTGELKIVGAYYGLANGKVQILP